MKLSELLEALTTILPHKVIQNTADRKQYGISFKDKLFIVTFEMLAPTYASVSFYEHDENNQPVYDVTGNVGYAGHLFATVVSIINQEFENLDAIAYTASGQSRKRLYGSIIKKHAQKYNTYLIPVNNIEVTVVSKHIFNKEQLDQSTNAAYDNLT